MATPPEVVAIARQIADGEIEPYRGAAAIWAFLTELPNDPEHLRVFVGLASEWQDHPQHRRAYEADIKREALLLLKRDAP